VPWVIVVPGLLLAVAMHIAAPIAGGWYAFTNWNGIGAAKWVGLGNFREIVHTHDVRESLVHTLELAGVFVVVVNVVGIGLALGLNRIVKSRHLLRAIFFLPFVMSPLATAYIWHYIFDYNGPLNQLLGLLGLDSWKHLWLADPHWALWVILVVMVWQYGGLAMVLYLAGLQSIPDELYEAAAVDGAPAWLTFRRLTFPLLAPAFTISATLTLIFGLRAFDQVLALTGGGPGNATQTLATEFFTQTFFNGRFGFGAAIALILTLLIMVMAILQVTILRRREARI
jgi:raffinose/stachyose/melibiose transport system permease protein